MAVKHGFTFHDLATMENVYSPAIGALNEPIVVAATNGLDELRKAGKPDMTPSFSRWLRENSEHYLMVGAHEQLARRYPAPAAPAPARASSSSFWLRVFAPIYRALPWPLRHRDHARDARQPPPDLGTAAASAGTGGLRHRWEPHRRSRNPTTEKRWTGGPDRG